MYSEEARVRLYTPAKESGHTIYNTIMSHRSKSQDMFIEVNANTLDNLLLQNKVKEDQIKWIKIDVEGAEFEVLKGAHNLLSKSTNIVLIIEVHSLDLYKVVVGFFSLYKFRIEIERGKGDWRHIMLRKVSRSDYMIG